MKSVAIIDSGVANLASIRCALQRLGVRATIARVPKDAKGATHIVLPGVGSFGAAIDRIRSSGLDRVVTASVEGSRPVLAVCLGMQLLCEGSEESPNKTGLGLVEGKCRRLPSTVRLPHLGWNWVQAGEEPGCLSSGHAAFANSYALVEPPANGRVAWTTHGTRFVAALERGSLLACQFHPELSGGWGLELLGRWLDGAGVEPSDGDATHRCGVVRRIVPCLDVRDGRVVKGVQFGNLQDQGDPATRAAAYERQGADELVLLDIAASPAGRATQLQTVRRVREVLTISLTVGGGVRSTADARRLLAAGADKVSVNTAAVERRGLIAELAGEFGSQCVVLAIDARRRGAGWETLVMGGRQSAGLDAVEWARRGVALGAGELLLTSWDRDGTRRGFDLELLTGVTRAVSVPVIASGGIGDCDDIADGFEAGASAVLAASIFHDSTHSAVDIKRDMARRRLRVRL